MHEGIKLLNFILLQNQVASIYSTLNDIKHLSMNISSGLMYI